MGTLKRKPAYKVCGNMLIAFFININYYRCWSPYNLESMNALALNEWTEVSISQYCWDDNDDYYDYSDYYDYYGYYRSQPRYVDHGCDTLLSLSGTGNQMSYQHTLGNRDDAFQTHRNVVVYGSMPSNGIFGAADVEIQDYSFANT